ncbi:hypothetical protein [Dongia rigui]|uniref:Uncharacterized protein n=1 Tax=Dongia rigui TaxID=940149 RepID=A0ABU5DYK7_9PROT|nr:hypothetical protein [Dongia rigui]MDY0872421.1 hypothetical protein [Dongia rigui]
MSADAMTDDDFLAALESCRIDPAAFNHAAHLRAGFLYLQRHDFAAALGAMRHAIQRFAAAIGKDGLYHETITCAFMTLINERLATESVGIRWEGFALRHADLFDGTALSQHYSRERLQHPLARTVFLLPDRVPGEKAA